MQTIENKRSLSCFKEKTATKGNLSLNMEILRATPFSSSKTEDIGSNSCKLLFFSRRYEKELNQNHFPRRMILELCDDFSSDVIPTTRSSNIVSLMGITSHRKTPSLTNERENEQIPRKASESKRDNFTQSCSSETSSVSFIEYAIQDRNIHQEKDQSYRDQNISENKSSSSRFSIEEKLLVNQLIEYIEERVKDKFQFEELHFSLKEIMDIVVDRWNREAKGLSFWQLKDIFQVEINDHIGFQRYCCFEELWAFLNRC